MRIYRPNIHRELGERENIIFVPDFTHIISAMVVYQSFYHSLDYVLVGR